MIRESILSVGSPIPLHGVVSEPDATRDNGTTLIILNSGLLHHVGSCLLSVQLARGAATKGIRAIRVDFSGIGDSGARQGTVDHEQRSIDETCEVMDFAQERWGSERFILSGLCSGAYAAFGAALRNERVEGIAGIAPFGYRTRKWYLNHYRERLLNKRRWLNLVQKLLGNRRARSEGYSSEFIEASANIGWNVPAQSQLQSDYQTLLSRGVQFLHTFTGGEADIYNYHGQMRDMFPAIDFGNALQELYLPEARHIITEPACQLQVVETTQQWIATHWSGIG